MKIVLVLLLVLLLSCHVEGSLPPDEDFEPDLVVPLPPREEFIAGLRHFPTGNYGSRQRRSVKGAPKTNRCHKVSKLPRGIVNRYKLNITFYAKYTSAYRIPVMSSSFVDSRALQRACYIIRVMLAGRKDLRDHLFSNKGRITVMARNQTVPMVPEMWMYTSWEGRAVGGTFYNPVNIIGEEHLLCENDNYSPIQDILVHEVAHAIHTTASPTALAELDYWITRSYHSAMIKDLWNNTYAATNHLEYFAEGVQSYFNQQREGTIGGDGIQNNINTLSELKKYDPTFSKLIKRVFPCRNHIISRCDDISQKKSLKQKLRMDCDYEEFALPPKGTCKDDHWSCPSWAEIGECKRNPSYMLVSCKRSCKVCTEDSQTIVPEVDQATILRVTTESSNGKCTDAHDDCKKWRSHCDSLSHVRQICKFTCGLCQTSTETTTVPFSSTTPAPTTTGATGDCSDQDRKCSSWQGFCSTASYVREKCRLTCGLCESASAIETTAMTPDTTPEIVAEVDLPNCTDADENCPNWASYCQSLAHIRNLCRRTCGVCAVATITTTETITTKSTTTATPVLTTKATPIVDEECTDNDPNCNSWASYCSTEYVRTNCKLMCNLCGLKDTTSTRNEIIVVNSPTMQKESTTCLDDDSNCDIWKSYCHETYVRQNCKSTCNLCLEVSNITEAVDVDPNCQDSDSNCPSWNLYCSRRYVREHCKFTCGLCGSSTRISATQSPSPGTQNGCVDQDINCKSWTAHCSSKRYVMENCRKTCGLCTANSSLPALLSGTHALTREARRDSRRDGRRRRRPHHARRKRLRLD